MRFTLLALILLAAAVRADTIIMKTGQKLEGKILSTNGETVEVEVEYGTMRVPAALIQSVESDTPEKITAREEEKAAEKEFVESMRAEGKVLYKGKWIDEEEKKEIETKLAAEKKKKDEEAAKKREEQRKREEEERRRIEQLAQQNGGRYDARADRFNRSRGRDGAGNNTTTNNNNYNNTDRYNRNRGSYGRDVNQTIDDLQRRMGR